MQLEWQPHQQVLKLRAVGYDVGAAARDSIGLAEYAGQHAKVTQAKGPKHRMG